MAKTARTNGVAVPFGAPSAVDDIGEVRFSEKKFAEITHMRRTVRVPVDYIHSEQIVKHRVKSSLGVTNYVDPLVLLAALREPTDVLIPGAKYDVRFYAIGGKTSSAEGLKFLRAQRSLFVGPQGISAIYGLYNGAFPCDRWVVALDDRGHLFADDNGSYRVPMLMQPLCAGASFSLGYFEHAWHNKHVLLCIKRIG